MECLPWARMNKMPSVESSMLNLLTPVSLSLLEQASHSTKVEGNAEGGRDVLDRATSGGVKLQTLAGPLGLGIVAKQGQHGP